jgi:hypothetical protein
MEHLTGLQEPRPTHRSTATPSSRRRQTAALVSHCAKLLSSTFRCCRATLTPPMCAGSHHSAPIPPRQLPLLAHHRSPVGAALRFAIVAGCELVCKTFLGSHAVTDALYVLVLAIQSPVPHRRRHRAACSTHARSLGAVPCGRTSWAGWLLVATPGQAIRHLVLASLVTIDRAQASWLHCGLGLQSYFQPITPDSV